MISIRDYNNTKCDLAILESRLSLLLIKKDKIFCKYFPLTSKQTEVKNDGGPINTDKIGEYTAEITKKDPITGLSLEEEIEEKRNEKQELEYYLRKMEYRIKKIKGLEADLYKKIVLEQLSVTKSVSEVAEEYNKDKSTIWRLYRKKIKKNIENLKMLVK